MSERIGVYICACGPNIKDAVHMDNLVDYSAALDGVVLARPFGLLCSEDGKKLLKKDIIEHKLTRVVIAACSPKEHEKTFSAVLEEAGLNPYFLHMANIREQCAWVVKDKVLATDKAKALIRAAVRRVALHEALESREIDCNTDALVVGSGVSGMSAALTLAQKNRKVYLVEKLPFIGGRVARFEEVYPDMECASCMLDPVMDEVLHNDNIEVLTCSDIEEVLGYYGNFTVRLKKRARCVDAESCIGCGACFEVCPVKVPNEFNEGMNERGAVYIAHPGALPNTAVIDRDNCLRFNGAECDACKNACPFAAIDYERQDEILNINVGAVIVAAGYKLFELNRAPEYGYGSVENVYTSLEFERLLSATGPTGGKVLKKDGQPPEEIALIHCVGSRTAGYDDYCSGICCAYMLKFASMIKERIPQAIVKHLYIDICVSGKGGQALYEKTASLEGINFIRLKRPDCIRVTEKDKKISVEFQKACGEEATVDCDMVVLAPAVEGSRDSEFLASVFDIDKDKNGFFTELHTKLAPVSTTSEGILIAGCAQSPQNIQESIAQGTAAGGVVLSKLMPGEKLKQEVLTAFVVEDVCSGCKTCIGLCPYKAINFDTDKKVAVINEVLCRGCGICAASCPSAAIKAKHFTDGQICGEIEGLLE